MTRLDTRSRDILLVLLKTQNPISVKQIAHHLDITPRMMRASLDSIQTWLESRDAKLIRKQNSGIQIETTPNQIIRLIQEISTQEKYYLNLSSTERINILVTMLICHPETYLAPEKIMNILGISRPTLNKDSVKVQKWLEKFSLALVYKKGDGFIVQGNEVNWREAIVHLFIEKIGVIPLLAMCNSPDGQAYSLNNPNLDQQSTILTDTVQSLDLKSAHNFIKRLEDVIHQPFVDTAYIRLVCHLALAVFRSSQNKFVEVQNDVEDDIRNAELTEIIANLLASSPIVLGPSEVEFFIHQVLGAKTQYSLIDLFQSRSALIEHQETQEIVQHIIDSASLYLHPSLKVDQQLIRALTFHVQVAINRLKYDLPIENPLKEAVEEQFPYIVSVVERSVSSLAFPFEKPVPPEEIAYIAMHLGAAMERLHPLMGSKRKVWVVCAEGTATAWLLVARLQAEIPEIVVDQVSSIIEIMNNPPNPNELDLVLTTLPLDIPNLLTLEINPLLTINDITRIHTALNHSIQRKSINLSNDHKIGLALSSLLTNETIRLGMTVDHWENVVELAGNLLVRVHATSSRYTNAMKEVIYRYGPYVVFSPGVALLHARSDDGVNRTCMSLVTLDPPIPFHHPHNDPVKVAFALSVVDHRSHLKAMAQLADLLNDEPRLSRIRATTSVLEVLDIIS